LGKQAEKPEDAKGRGDSGSTQATVGAFHFSTARFFRAACFGAANRRHLYVVIQT